MSQETAPHHTDLRGGETAAIWDDIDQETLSELYGAAVRGKGMGEAFHEWQRPPFNQLESVRLSAVDGISSKHNSDAQRLDHEYTSLRLYLQSAGMTDGEVPRHQAERSLTWTSTSAGRRSGSTTFTRVRPLLYATLDDGGVGVIYKETTISLPILRILQFYGALQQPPESRATPRYQAVAGQPRSFTTTDPTALSVVEGLIDSPTTYPASTSFGFRRLSSQ